MHDQPRYEPMQVSELFRDHRSERPLLPGTVARGFLRADQGMYTGKTNGQDVTSFPFPITMQVVQRGRERYNIYCSPCHSLTGDGDGMIVQRGFSKPPSYYVDRLQKAPVGHFFDVITNGYGAMQSYASRVEPQDRWAIIAYIRALQLSRTAKASDVPADKQAELESSPATMPPAITPSSAPGSVPAMDNTPVPVPTPGSPSPKLSGGAGGGAAPGSRQPSSNTGAVQERGGVQGNPAVKEGTK